MPRGVYVRKPGRTSGIRGAILELMLLVGLSNRLPNCSKSLNIQYSGCLGEIGIPTESKLGKQKEGK